MSITRKNRKTDNFKLHQKKNEGQRRQLEAEQTVLEKGSGEGGDKQLVSTSPVHTVL